VIVNDAAVIKNLLLDQIRFAEKIGVAVAVEAIKTAIGGSA
jgi:hypothetical protein